MPGGSIAHKFKEAKNQIASATSEANKSRAVAELASLQAQIVEAGQATSSTHMNDYKAWMHATETWLPADLLPMLQTETKSAFNLWLQCKQKHG